MSVAGVFTIITNDGKQDKLLMASDFLKSRLENIHQAKFNANRINNPSIPADHKDNLPTLADIERTHMLLTNATFKPFAAFGFEYNKVRPSSGQPALGNTIQFNIPQFGDFFHDIAFHCVLQQPVITPSDPNDHGNSPAMRWCDYPGERLLKRVQQEVNGNSLDEYYTEAIVAHREYRVAPNKLAAWKRCVGQEEPEIGYSRQDDRVGGETKAQSHRVKHEVFTGLQTPSAQKLGTVELFVPLLFWYNRDVRLAIPSVAIPYGQRFINIDLAAKDDLVALVPRGTGTAAEPNGVLGDIAISQVELYINNIFMNAEIHKIYIKRIGFSLIRVHRMQTFTLNTGSGDVLLQQMKWPIEYIFVGAKPNSQYKPTTLAEKSMSMDTWHKYCSAETKTYFDSPEGMVPFDIVGADGEGKVGAVNADGKCTGAYALTQDIAVGDALLMDGKLLVVATGAAKGAPFNTVIVQHPIPGGADITNATVQKIAVSSYRKEIQTRKWTPVLDQITIKLQGIEFYKEMPRLFLNGYTPYHYGGPNIGTPTDTGSIFVPFCMYPGTFQPSGHLNVSRAREFYLYWTSSIVDANKPATMIVIASAINFLLISDGSAVLRYST